MYCRKMWVFILNLWGTFAEPKNKEMTEVPFRKISLTALWRVNWSGLGCD